MTITDRRPWMKFYPTDWRGDAGLRGCSFAARGLWMDMLTLMHEADPYGHLVVNGIHPTSKRLGAMLGGDAKQIALLVSELEEGGVFSRTDDGTIYSRRMVRDAERAEADKANGSRGGNPSLKPGTNGNVKGGVNPPRNPDLNLSDKARARASPIASTARSQKEEASDLTVGAPDAAHDVRQILWSDGLTAYRRLTGRLDGPSRRRLGQLLREAHDDCGAVLGALQECPITPDADAWLTAAVQARASPKPSGKLGFLAKYDGPIPGDPEGMWPLSERVQ